ncbi:MAG: Zn-dependent hydrolase [Bacteroidales bacterium]|nr:Zn-dependent hydrolase [Bacteroidales bacterium]
MKKSIFILTVAALMASCNESGKRLPDYADYTVVEIGKEETPFLEGITENGKEVLNLYRFAAMEADRIYWKQVFGDKAALDSISDPAARDYAMINYGPWDRLNDKAFLKGYPEQMPAGAMFYPLDMTDEEFLAFGDADKNNPYTLIRRGEDGKLKTVWFHEEYAESIEKICNYLKAAADLTIVPSVREYLLAKVDALQNDSYRDCEIKWLDMDNSKMDLVLGPNENQDDKLYGIKRSFSAYVVLKDLKMTENLKKFAGMMTRMQDALPCKEEYKSFRPGAESNIFACDALYYAGEANACIKDIAINLPFDPAVQAEKGTRTILMSNVINAKFNHIINPIADLMICDDEREHVDREAFFWNVAFREVAHGLGVKTTLDGADVDERLGNMALTIEEAKADILGVYFSQMMIGNFETNSIVTRKDAFTTFLAGLLRSSRFGNSEAVGKGNIICYQYLKEQGAYSRHHDGRYYIDWNVVDEAVAALAADLLEIQGKGDYDAAKAFVEKYSVIDADLSADIRNMRLEQLPVDVKFEFVW